LYIIATAEVSQLVLASGATHNLFNDKKDVAKPIRKLLKRIYGDRYWDEEKHMDLSTAKLFARIPPDLTSVETVPPRTGGIFSSMFASSAALLEGSGAITKGDDTVRVDKKSDAS